MHFKILNFIRISEKMWPISWILLHVVDILFHVDPCYCLVKNNIWSLIWILHDEEF